MLLVTLLLVVNARLLYAPQTPDAELALALLLPPMHAATSSESAPEISIDAPSDVHELDGADRANVPAAPLRQRSEAAEDTRPILWEARERELLLASNAALVILLLPVVFATWYRGARSRQSM